jgi:hypothetical protein
LHLRRIDAIDGVAQLLSELPNIAEPGVGVRGHRSADNRRQWSTPAASGGSGPSGSPLTKGLQQRSEPEDVRGGSRRPPCAHLRRHVPVCSANKARPHDVDCAGANKLGEAKVRDDHALILVDQNIPGFEVAMHDALGVGVGKGSRGVTHNSRGFGGQQAGAFQTAMQVLNEWQEFIQLNAEMAARLPPIFERKTPLANG